VIVLSAGVSVHGRGHHRVGRWVLGLGVSLAAYAEVAGAATVFASPWVVAVEAAWFMVPITLAGACCLVAAEELTEGPGSLRGGWLLPTGVGAAGMLVGFGTLTYEPYPGLPAPLGHTVLGHPAMAVVFGVCTALWMVSTTLAPALVLRAARRSRGLRRGRLTIVAITAATPLLTLATCVLVSIGAGARLLDDRFATVVVSVAFCLPPALVAVGLTVACSARDDGVTGTIGRAARWVLRGLWVVITAQLAALLAALLAVGSGTPSALAASTFAVVLGVVFVAGYGPVASRIERFVAQPAAAEPAAAEPVVDQPVDEPGGRPAVGGLEPSPMGGTLSPREGDVLRLIAEGRSNAAIAAELVLSERTIDSHVSSIFDKLGLGREAGTNRRVQAAAAWIRADLELRGRVG
jgi:DNA-binding CsgD family transcriptional regulator